MTSVGVAFGDIQIVLRNGDTGKEAVFEASLIGEGPGTGAKNPSDPRRILTAQEARRASQVLKDVRGRRVEGGFKAVSEAE
jgi:hypothetical protein